MHACRAAACPRAASSGPMLATRRLAEERAWRRGLLLPRCALARRSCRCVLRAASRRRDQADRRRTDRERRHLGFSTWFLPRTSLLSSSFCRAKGVAPDAALAAARTPASADPPQVLPGPSRPFPAAASDRSERPSWRRRSASWVQARSSAARLMPPETRQRAIAVLRGAASLRPSFSTRRRAAGSVDRRLPSAAAEGRRGPRPARVACATMPLGGSRLLADGQAPAWRDGRC